MRNPILFLSTLVAALLILPSTSAADVPHLITYQGRLTDNSGNPVSDGAYQARFRIYDAATGGSTLWDNGSVSVTVTNGVFSYTLGQATALPVSLFDNSTVRWLGVTVGTDAELTPRTQLVSVPYAYHAQSSDTAAYALSGAGSGGVWVDEGTVIHPVNIHDSVGIGTNDPNAPLVVEATGNAIVGHSTGSGQVAGVIGGNDGNGFGVLGSTNTGRGVYGMAFDGFGGYFTGAKHYFDKNVGIGTEEPAEMLHVYEDDSGEDAYIEVESDHATNYGEAGIRFRNPSAEWRLSLGDGDNDPISNASLGLFYSYSLSPAPIMQFVGLGNVGIGSAPSASYRLTLDGEEGGISASAFGATRAAVRGENSAGFGAYFVAPRHYFSNLTGFGTDDPTHTVTVNGAIALQQGEVTKYHLDHYNGGLNLCETSVADYRLFVKDGGNVGIGTSNPTTRLYVNGSFHANSFESNAIGRANIVDEVGIASAPTDGDNHPLTTSWQPYMTRELTVPTAGYILAIGCANLYLAHDAIDMTGGYIGFSDDPNSFDGHSQQYDLNSSVSSGGRSCSIPCMHLFYVPASGTYTYYMVAQRHVGNDVVLRYAEMNLLFIPTVYSSNIGQLVAPDNAADMEANADGSSVDSPAPSEPSVAEIADRIENLTSELADLKAQLERIEKK